MEDVFLIVHPIICQHFTKTGIATLQATAVMYSKLCKNSHQHHSLYET